MGPPLPCLQVLTDQVVAKFLLQQLGHPFLHKDRQTGKWTTTAAPHPYMVLYPTPYTWCCAPPPAQCGHALTHSVLLLAVVLQREDEGILRSNECIFLGIRRGQAEDSSQLALPTSNCCEPCTLMVFSTRAKESRVVGVPPWVTTIPPTSSEANRTVHSIGTLHRPCPTHQPRPL